ncbi:DNA polymerase sliding clamp [Pyrodictium occultum]|uniref:DNA polymerase sliding clamp n=1 Tax=Pyrodictium occultum TaxID=2309 RepID=UPI0008A93931|nr:DNA polymerase sliding clamp [Pyrodictium occultum]
MSSLELGVYRVVARARLSYPDAKSFYNMLDAISKIVDEITMIITSDGVRAVALDPAHVALINIELPPESFIEYEVEDGEVKLGFNVANTAKIVKRGKKGDKLDIEVDEERVTWSIVGATIKRYRLLNLDVPVPEVPEAQLEFKIRIAMVVDPFKNALKDAEAVGDTVELEAPDENTFIIRGVGAATAEAKIRSDSPAVVEFHVEEPGKSAYSIEYLKHVLSLTRVADTITIEFSQNMPLRLKFQLPAGGGVTYLLAPKAA